jgi:hypothetical protein
MAARNERRAELARALPSDDDAVSAKRDMAARNERRAELARALPSDDDAVSAKRDMAARNERRANVFAIPRDSNALSASARYGG